MKSNIVTYYMGNPYINESKLNSMAFSLIVPADVKDDILLRDEKGTKAFETFVQQLTVGNS